ncbi:MAG: methyltransferase domain-containing protein [Chitinophagaceae bacterium]
MLDFSKRSTQLELLDGENLGYEDIVQNMYELNTINTYLGGHAISIAGLNKIRKQKTKLHIVEIGCGGGDNLKAIQMYCKKINIETKLTGLDIQKSICEYAQIQNPTFHIIHHDYKTYEFEQKPDIIFSSLFCHHFSTEELIEQLKWMYQNSVLGFFINDLHRSTLAYYSIKLLTSLFSTSYLVKNDAPLSVARSFKKQDWIYISQQSHIPFRIQWKWAFRYLISYSHENI